jgi:hypothetical protein
MAFPAVGLRLLKPEFVLVSDNIQCGNYEAEGSDGASIVFASVNERGYRKVQYPDSTGSGA